LERTGDPRPRGNNRFDRTLLSLGGIERDVRQEAVNTLLKGPEIDVPGGLKYDGRKEMRVKWWSNDRPFTYRNVALQVPFELPNDPYANGDRKSQWLWNGCATRALRALWLSKTSGALCA